MRVSLLFTVALAFSAAIGMVAADNPAAPVHKGAAFQGGAATCQPGSGIIALDGSSSSPNSPAAGCAPCIAGYYQAGVGALACTACPAGSWSPVGSPACYSCPDGTVSQAASDSCTECGWGTATTAAKNSQGYSSGFSEASNTYYGITAVSHTTCWPCAVNFYQPAAAQSTCIACPPNTSTNGAKGAGACFAVGGGHTVKSLLETSQAPNGKKSSPKSGQVGLGSNKGNSDMANVKPASAAPRAPKINKAARQRYTHAEVRNAGKFKKF